MKVIVNENARDKTNVSTLFLSAGKRYEVIAKEPFVNGDWYRIVDDSDEDYLYPPSLFDVIEE